MRRISVTKIVAGASLVWLAVGLFLAGYSGYPDGCASRLPCLALNEWGDFLAGIFAPLAFFWLVAAVFIQSQELYAQRQELQANREEMRHQREVMKAQADEARKQAEFIGLQTAILSRQDEAAQVAQKNSDFEGALADLSNLIDLKLNGNHWLWGTTQNGDRTSLRFSTNNSGREELIRDLVKFFRYKTQAGHIPPFGVVRTELPVAKAIVGYIDRATEVASDCGNRHSAMLELFELPQLRKEMQSVIEETESAVANPKTASSDAV